MEQMATRRRVLVSPIMENPQRLVCAREEPGRGQSTLARDPIEKSTEPRLALGEVERVDVAPDPLGLRPAGEFIDDRERGEHLGRGARELE